MTIKQLEYFYTVAALQSYTAASKQLYVAQSALSSAIRNLEDELSITLFIADGRNIKLTDSGRVLMELTKDILASFDMFSNKAHAIAEQDFGQLRIGIPPLIDSLILNEFLSEFCEQHPNIQVSVIVEGARNVQQRVLSHDLNFGFCMEPVSHDLTSVPFFDSTLVAVMSPENPLAAGSRLTVKMLRNEQLLVLGTEHEIFYYIDRLFREQNTPLNVRLTSSNISFIISLVRKNLGITLQQKFIAESFQSGDIVCRQVKGLDKSVRVYLVHPKRELYHEELLFMDLFRKWTDEDRFRLAERGLALSE